MTYKIETNYLEHDGGTKFYETVLISEDGGPAILVKRYGSIDKKMGGGQTIIDRGNRNACVQGCMKILAEKTKLRPGKGQYVEADRILYGLHPHDQRNVNAFELEKAVTDHFNRSDSDAIKSYFGITGGAPGAAVVKEEPAAAGPEEPIIRDAHWGSW